MSLLDWHIPRNLDNTDSKYPVPIVWCLFAHEEIPDRSVSEESEIIKRLVKVYAQKPSGSGIDGIARVNACLSERKGLTCLDHAWWRTQDPRYSEMYHQDIQKYTLDAVKLENFYASKGDKVIRQIGVDTEL